MRYFYPTILTGLIIVLMGCSGGNSPVTPSNDETSGHSAAVSAALDGVDNLNPENIEIYLDGNLLTPWGMHQILLENGTYPFEVRTSGTDVEINISVDGAELLVDGIPHDSWTGSTSPNLQLTGITGLIKLRIEIRSETPHTRELDIRTVDNGHLLIPEIRGVVQHTDPVLGITFDIVDRDLMVGVRDGTTIDVIEALVNRLDSELLYVIEEIDAYQVRIPGGISYDTMSDMFMESSVVTYAEVNAINYPDIIPNDTYEDLEYGNDLCRLYDAWDIHTGGPSSIIGIIDTGVMRDHPDLAANVINGEDFINPIGDGLGGATPGDGQDNNNDGVIDGNVSHGTHVAGITGAIGNNSEGVSGHSWSTTILPLRVFPIDGDSGASDSSIANAITYALANGAIAVNMSLGSGFPSSTIENACNSYWANGGLPIAAAGNSNSSGAFYPAGFTSVMSVASTNSSDRKSGFSNYGTLVEVSAPGSGIASCIFYQHGGDPNSVPENQRYALFSGTSMASPQVAGLAALIASYFPSYSAAEIRDQIIFSTDNIDAVNPGFEGLLGTGRINDFRALTTPLEPDFELGPFITDEDNPLYSQGNRDGFLNPGEIIEFYPSIKNTGLKSASDVVVTLEGGVGSVELFIASASIAFIDRGETVRADTPIIFRISKDATDTQIASMNFHLELTGWDPFDLPFDLTVRADLGVVDTIEFTGENLLGDDIAKGSVRVPVLKFTMEGDTNYGTLDSMVLHQIGTAGTDDLGELELWLDENDDGTFSQLFDTKIAFQSYDHTGYRGQFDDLNDPLSGFGTGIDYEQFGPLFFNDAGLAVFEEIIIPTAPGVSRTLFLTLNILPTATTGDTVQVTIADAFDVIVRAPDQVNPLNFPILTNEVPIVGRWLTPQELTDAGPGSQKYSWRPETAVCPVTGNIYVAFDTNRNTNFDVMIRRSTDQAESFENAILLDSSSANEFYPDVGVDVNGVVHVVYYSTKISNGNREIYYVRSEDFGVSFGAPVRLTSASGDSRMPKLAIDNDNLHITWHDERAGANDYNIYYKKSIDGGDNWTADKLVADTTNWSEEAAIAVGGDGVIHITWEEFTNFFSANTWYSRSTDNGANFSTRFQITSGQYNGDGWHSDVAADDIGNVYVVFHYVPGNIAAEVSMRISNDSGFTWEPIFNMTSNTIPDSRPAVHVTPDGSYVDVTYRQLAAENWNIWHTQSETNGGSWNDPVQISISDGGDAREAVVVRTENLNIYSFWEDVVDSSGSYEVFWNRFLY